jgi:hypothetical protein
MTESFKASKQIQEGCNFALITQKVTEGLEESESDNQVMFWESDAGCCCSEQEW